MVAQFATNCEATFDNNTILIEWKSNNAGTVSFDIEKSFDGNRWFNLTTVTSTPAAHYSYVDHAINTITIFYRLKQTDEQNITHYSNVVTIRSCNSPNNNAFVYPNPAEKIIKVLLPATFDNYPAAIYNSTGTLIKLIVLASTTSIDVSDLQPSLYFIKSQSGAFQTMKFIKL